MEQLGRGRAQGRRSMCRIEYPYTWGFSGCLTELQDRAQRGAASLCTLALGLGLTNVRGRLGFRCGVRRVPLRF